MRQGTFVFILFICSKIVVGQLLFEENFDYPAGDTLTYHNWVQFRTGALPVVASEGLSYPGFIASSIGNAAVITSAGGGEIKRVFAEQNSDSVYVSFLVKIMDAPVGDYRLFFYAGPPEMKIFDRRLSFFVKKWESADLSFGVSKLGGTKVTNPDYSLDSTYLVVLKYTFNPDTNDDDMLSMWINPPFSDTEPPPLTQISEGEDAPGLAEIALSQITLSNQPPDAIVDGIVVAKEWSELFVDVAQFKDANLEQVVRIALNKPAGEIRDIDMEKLTSLYAAGKQITDISGLEYAVNLTTLNLQLNQITDISPISGLTKLTTLYLHTNRINDISALQNLTDLTLLHLAHNSITDFQPLSNLTKLTFLSLGNTAAVDISVLQNMTQMQKLYLYANEITDISTIQNMTELVELDLGANAVTDISALADKVKLQLLLLSDNHITDISPLAGLTGLSTLTLSYNNFTDLSPLYGLNQLGQLSLESAGVQDITFLETFSQLRSLYLSVNQISDLSPLNTLTSLRSLSLSLNDVTDITPLQNLVNLYMLDLSFNRLRDISTLGNFTGLTQFYCSNTYLDHQDLITFYDLDSLETLKLYNNPGLISGTAIEELAENLLHLDAGEIEWSGTAGVDHDSTAFCWIFPYDSAAVGEQVSALATATSSSGKKLQVKIDWDDGNVSDYSDLKDNAAVFEFSHVYEVDGWYDIKVMARDESGSETAWSVSWRLVVGHPIVAVANDGKIIKHFKLEQNYPNPFNPVTSIQYDLKGKSHVELVIYNYRGQLVRRLINCPQTMGSHLVKWDGRDEEGKQVAGGVYFYKIQIDSKDESFIDVKKMICLR
ncbi:leucine-rich repeat domain-containing protein [candidate division KSB1 bacterium]|nr:leucine-rich repeat domain-containing protein [candidate division KSB1 bacterium]